MKAHISSLTQPANNKRSRTILAMVAGLIVLAAAIVGAALVLSQRARAPEIISGAAAHRPLLATCRVCADEALAARQGAAPNARHAAQRGVANANARPLIVTCRVCADEVLAAHQSSVPARAQPASAGLSFHPLFAYCRACRDEALGNTSINIGAAEPSLVMPAPVELIRRTGPR